MDERGTATASDAVAHGYTMWPADALPARRGVAAAHTTLRAARTEQGPAQARLFEEAVIAATVDLHAAQPASRAAARLTIAAGVDGLRRLAERAPALDTTPTGDPVADFMTTLGEATRLRDLGHPDAARERLSSALLAGTILDGSAASSFSFAAQAAAALRVHDAVWAPAHQVVRDLPGRSHRRATGAGLDSH
jgi:hypothetical protein